MPSEKALVFDIKENSRPHRREGPTSTLRMPRMFQRSRVLENIFGFRQFLRFSEIAKALGVEGGVGLYVVRKFRKHAWGPAEDYFAQRVVLSRDLQK